MTNTLSQSLLDRITAQRTRIVRMTHAITSRLAYTSERAQQLISRISSVSLRLRDAIAASTEQLVGMRRIIVALSPQKTLERGYSITKSASGKIIKDASDISVGQTVETTFATGTISSVVQGKGA